MDKFQCIDNQFIRLGSLLANCYIDSDEYSRLLTHLANQLNKPELETPNTEEPSCI